MVNTVSLVGNLGKDAELKNTGTTPVAEFSLATTEKYNGQSKTQWHNIVLFGKVADALSQYLKKGKQVYVSGSIDYQSWDKKDGTKGYKTVIKAFQVQLLGSKEDSGMDRQDQKFQEQVSQEIPF